MTGLRSNQRRSNQPRSNQPRSNAMVRFALAGVMVMLVGGAAVPAAPLPAAPVIAARATVETVTHRARAGPGGPGALRWGSCSAALPPDYQCATLRVPLDGEVTGSAGPSIGLALDRHRATGTRIGSLVVNPGGPGVSGLNALPDIVSVLSPALRADFDIVGFDPPGVGASDPVRCLGPSALASYLDLDPAPGTAAGLEALVAGERRFTAGCRHRSATILPHVSTVAAARDLDRIRQALGESRLTYLGFSYGTFLGATYAELYPARVRGLVLDGAIDPTQSPVATIDAQSIAIDGELTRMEVSCARSSTCPWRTTGGDLGQAYRRLLARVRTHPLDTGSGARTVGPAELLYGTAAGLYSTTTWPELEQALADATGGDGTSILGLFDGYTGRRANGTFANTIEAETAVNCIDDPVPSLAQLEAGGPAAAVAAPVFGVLDLFGEIPCALWPVPATGTPHAIRAEGSAPIVVVGSTGDPVTPYAGARHLAAELARGVLLTRVGDGHTAYAASSCVRRAVDRYLILLIPPSAGLRCASD